MIKIIAGVFLVLHGLIHLLYFGQSARLLELQSGMIWPDGSWIFSKLLGDNGTRTLAAVANKNGIYYAFDRDHLNGGPLWQVQIAEGGDCPECGQSAISSSGFDGATLFIAGGLTTIKGQSCQGSVRAVNPADGTYLWETCFNGTEQYPTSVLGSVTVTPEMVFAGAGASLYGLDKSNGHVLMNVPGKKGDGQPQPPYFWGSPSVANGVIYIGNMDGTLYAIGR